jgi:tRNA threonylcarbamoyl adenosine modification protein YeaZ
MLLSIDSSSGTSVAVVSREGVTLANQTSNDPRAHAELIGLLLEQALAEAGVTPSDITAVVMGVGPGPYTGLRVGMAAAQAFALSRSLPLYPVISHDGAGFESAANCVVVTDARRGEVAYSVYRQTPTPQRIVGPALTRPETLDQELGEYAALARTEPAVSPADNLARVALSYLEHGWEFPSISPVYLRAPDVSVKP